MKKYYKKIISLAIILVLVLGLTCVFKNFINTSKAQTTDPFSGSTATGEIKTPSSTGTTGTTATDSEKCDPKNGDCKLPDPPAPYQSHENELTISEGLKKGQIATAWALSLDLVNVLAIFVLLAIAFANILHLGERDSFSYKRMIPAFVIGLIAANFSHLICRAIIDFAGMLMNFFVPKDLAAQVVGNIYTGMFSGWFGAAALGVGVIGTVVASFFGFGCVAIIIALVLLGVPVIISFILWFLLAARVYVLWFLVILSPIAFFGMFFDPLKRTIGTWWNWFLMWTFMGPIAYFFIYLAEGFSRDTSLNGSNLSNQCLDPSNAAQVGGLQKYLIVNILLVLAVYVPYALGSKIGMGIWAGVGKFLGGIGAWAGAGTGAAGARRIGGSRIGQSKIGKALRLDKLKDIQNPLTLPALPKGWEVSPAGMLWQKKREADIAATSKQLQKNVERGPFGLGLGRALTRNMNIEWGINQGASFAQGSGWDVGALGADQERIVNANLNAAPIKLGTNASREDTNIIAFRMQRLRELTGIGQNLKFSDIYGPGKSLQDAELKIQEKSKGKINRKKFKQIREQVDEEVSSAREARSAKGNARTFLAEDIMNGTALTLDGDLREGNLSYMASRRTTSRGHGSPGPI